MAQHPHSHPPNFKLFVSLDMDHESNINSDLIVNITKRYANNPVQWKINGKPVFGVILRKDYYMNSYNVWDKVNGSMNEAIDQLSHDNISIHSLSFIRATTGWLEDNMFKAFPFLDGFQSHYAWYFRDFESEYSYNDGRYLKDAHSFNKTFMGGATPGYFSHSSEENKVYFSEDSWHKTWELLIKSKADFGQVFSWNP